MCCCQQTPALGNFYTTPSTPTPSLTVINRKFGSDREIFLQLGESSTLVPTHTEKPEQKHIHKHNTDINPHIDPRPQRDRDKQTQTHLHTLTHTNTHTETHRVTHVHMSMFKHQTSTLTET